MSKPIVLLLGKLPPPYFGPAIATEILINSKLRATNSLYHLNTNVHKSINTIGKIHLVKIWKNIAIYLKLINIIVKRHPNLVHIPISQSTVGFLKDSLFILICKLLNCKVVLHLHGSNFKNWLHNSSRATRSYVEFIIKTTQGIIVLGKNLKYLFADYFPENQIYVVPNGANYNISKIVRKSKVANILFLSNLQPSKGVEDVINALVILKKQSNVNYEADIVGQWRDDVTKKICTRLVKDNSLHVQFNLSTFNSNKFTFYAKSDIFVFTPREPEGQPWVIIEAMAAGLPIISTDQGAITDMVIHGINGFIVDKHNPNQIAEKIKFLIENPKIRKKMGQDSRKHYLENFTEDKMVEKLSYCFNAVLNQN